MGSGAGLGWRAGWTQHRGKGAPLFDSGDHVDRREGEDAGGGGGSREGHGGGSRQRGARGHDSGAGRGGAGAAGKVVGDTTGRQHQSEQRGWGPTWAVGPTWAAEQAPGSDLPGGCEDPGETSTGQGQGMGWEPVGSWASSCLLESSGHSFLELEMTRPDWVKIKAEQEYPTKPSVCRGISRRESLKGGR